MKKLIIWTIIGLFFEVLMAQQISQNLIIDESTKKDLESELEAELKKQGLQLRDIKERKIDIYKEQEIDKLRDEAKKEIIENISKELKKFETKNRNRLGTIK